MQLLHLHGIALALNVATIALLSYQTKMERKMNSTDLLKRLRNFVSEEIYEFITSPNESETKSDLQSETQPTNSTPTVDLLADPSKVELIADPLEAELDSLLLQGSNVFEQDFADVEQPSVKRPRKDSGSGSTALVPSTSAKARKFALPKTEEEISLAKRGAIPATTHKDTKYCVTIWNEWCSHRLTNYRETIPPLEELNSSELASKLSSFIFEVRKKDGSEFLPDSLHHIVSGIQRFVRCNGKPGIDIYKDAEFADFRSCLDSEMKRLQRSGLGSRKRKAEPLSLEEEELFWRKRLLGDVNPQALVDTMVVMNGIYFALRSGSEHRQLRSDPCQIKLVEKPGHRSYLEYAEDISKNRQGGLKGRKLKPKVVHHYDNTDNPDRCFVRLFKRYQQLLPPDRPKNVFYFKPLQNPTADTWFSARPIGHNTLEHTVARLCSAAGIQGFRTNHSLRATAATRLYQAGVDEQLIMETTGHRSLEGVRSYKRTSDDQKQVLSDILNTRSSVQTPRAPLTVSAIPRQVNGDSHSSSDTNNYDKELVEISMQQNIHSTSQFTVPPTFNFHTCTVNINNYTVSNNH